MLRYILWIFFIFLTLSIGGGQDFPPPFVETSWDQGYPVIEGDRRALYLARVIFHIEHDWKDKDWSGKNKDSIVRVSCLELGSIFYDKGMIEGSMYYMGKAGPDEYRKMIIRKKHDYDQKKKLEARLAPKKEELIKPIVVEEPPKPEIKEPPVSRNDAQNIVMTTLMDIVQESSVPGKPVTIDLNITKQEKVELQEDQKLVTSLPKKYDLIPEKNLKSLKTKINDQIDVLNIEKQKLIQANASQFVISSKENAIKALLKEKDIIAAKIKANEINAEKDKNKRVFILIVVILVIIILGVFIYFQRKTIKVQDSEIDKQLLDIKEKNAYLEYAASLIRHDMHSGINTYIPRGLVSLERRIPEDDVEKLKIGPALKMMKDGLSHTQKVYKKVHEFTSLVKSDAQLDKKDVDVKELLTSYFEGTAFRSQVEIEDLSNLEVNEVLFCTAIDNLVRNGIKYNDSEMKKVKIYRENGSIVIEDNGRGLSSEEFKKLTTIKKGATEHKEGLGLDICIAILKEHNFTVNCELLTSGGETKGTKIKINT